MKMFLFLNIIALSGVLKFDSCTKNLGANEYVYWKKNRNIKWGDFQGRVSDTTFTAAGSFVQLKLTYKLNRKKSKLKKFDVISAFNKSVSWYRDTSSTLLNHEQKHFDLCEVYARQFRKRLYEIAKNDSLISDHKVQKIFNFYSEEHRRSQNEYDEATDRGTNQAVQTIWDKRIGNDLHSLQSFERK